MRKLRVFQPSGYLSLDLGSGTGEFYRLKRDMDLAAFVRDAQGAQAIEQFVERVAIDAPEGDALRLELESFIAAIEGRAPVAVSGVAGREALAVALKIGEEIERTLPSLKAPASARSRA
jgi:predicted dehydrogenase